MLKFPPELTVHKDNVLYFLYVVGGLLMTATAGSQCVDVVVRTAQNPANLQRLSNTLIGLMGLQCKIHAKSASPRKQKILYFSDSLKNLFDMTNTLQGRLHSKVLRLFPEEQMSRESSPANCISAKRCRIYFILLCGVRRRTILILCIGSKRSELKTFKPENQLQWLIQFSSEAQAQGDVVFLLLSAQSGRISSISDADDATHERYPSSLNLGLSLLFVFFLWMYLPHITVFALICFALKRTSRS
ncbi:uncharacterized protein LOC132958773 [Labrus mixtus]|uniref:uncharacterized protein LOC132958773 n=1 Tax=Labrus mixtus TaxID=508554 RepID=UPI0029C0B334|nr:uncharacterized protein LOC132958773 [Labrus mixtus]